MRPGGRGRDGSGYSKQRGGTVMFSNKTVTFLTQEALSHSQLSSPSHLLRNNLSCGVFSSHGLPRPQKVSPCHQITPFPSNCCYASKIEPLFHWSFLHVHSPMELNGFLQDCTPRISRKTASPQSNKHQQFTVKMCCDFHGHTPVPR